MENEKESKTAAGGAPVEAVVMCWGWIDRDLKVQGQTFSSVNAAIAEMCSRLSYDVADDHILDRIYMLGFKLVQAEKRVKAIRVLD